MASPPNIIYILSDQHNPDVLGANGNPFVRTPNLDSLAAEGVSLDNCYCASPLCVPSRTALLTGLLPSRTGITNNMQALSSHTATIAHALTLDGYETVLSGRMHFVGWDQRHGFQHRLVGDITPSFMGADNEAEIYGDFKRTSNQHIISIKKSGAGNSAVLQFDRDVTDAAIAYLKNRDSSNAPPLFMTVGLYGPHCPYIAPPDLYQYYYEILPEIGTVTEEEFSRLHPAMQNWQNIRGLSDVTDEDVRRIRAAYYGMVEYMDGLVGELLTAARQTLDMDNTVIVYSSDHGDNIGEHGLFWKTNFYEGSARVPMIYFRNGHYPAGKRIKGLTSLLDLAPTLLRIGGNHQLPAYDGIDLTPYLTGTEDIPDTREVFAECADIKGDNPSAMLRFGKYKLICHAGYDTPQLFDLEADPSETSDLAETPVGREILPRLLPRVMSRWDPAQAMRQLDLDKAHFRLVGGWVKQTNPLPIEEWRGDPSSNYTV